MEEVPGSFGTSASFALRLGQTVFSSASLLFMFLDNNFYSYTALCYLVTAMSLVTPWSAIMTLMDAYSILVKCLPRQARLLSIIISGDFVLSFLSLAAASSAAGVTDVLLDVSGSPCHAEKQCKRYQLSAAMGFLSWFLLFSSTLFNLWIFPSIIFHL